MTNASDTATPDPAAPIPPAPTPAAPPPAPSIMQLAASGSVPEASRDPIRLMMEIAANGDLTPTDRALIIQFARDRFKNRRRMAYICLYTIIASAIFLFVGAFVEGFCDKKVLTVISTHKDLFIWINFFLTSIVGAYYGVTAWRPSS